MAKTKLTSANDTPPVAANAPAAATSDEPGAAPERRAVDAGNRRLREAIERFQHRSERGRIGEVLCDAVPRHLRHPLEIGAGAEAFAFAQQNDGPNRSITIEISKNVRELGDQCRVERIVDVRA